MYGTALLSKLQLYCIGYDPVLHVRVLPHCVYFFRVRVFLHRCVLWRVYINLHNAELDCYGVLHPVKKCTAFFQYCVLHLFF